MEEDAKATSHENMVEEDHKYKIIDDAAKAADDHPNYQKSRFAQKINGSNVHKALLLIFAIAFMPTPLNDEETSKDTSTFLNLVSKEKDFGTHYFGAVGFILMSCMQDKVRV